MSNNEFDFILFILYIVLQQIFSAVQSFYFISFKNQGTDISIQKVMNKN